MVKRQEEMGLAEAWNHGTQDFAPIHPPTYHSLEAVISGSGALFSQRL